MDVQPPVDPDSIEVQSVTALNLPLLSIVIALFCDSGIPAFIHLKRNCVSIFDRLHPILRTHINFIDPVIEKRTVCKKLICDVLRADCKYLEWRFLCRVKIIFIRHLSGILIDRFSILQARSSRRKIINGCRSCRHISVLIIGIYS